MAKKARQPKETDAVRAKLDSYAALQRKIDNQLQRLQALEASIGSTSSPTLTGMPGGSGKRESEEDRYVTKKDDLKRKIEKLEQEERDLLDELEAMIDQLKDPDQQTVLEMRYIDRLPWRPICAALYSAEPDYEENTEKYLKRTFKRHGSALVSLARIYKAKEAEA